MTARSGRQPLIATRTSVETKQRFAVLAASRGMTQSRLLASMVDAVLERNLVSDEQADGPAATACDRLTVRLRPRDRARLQARAAAVGLRPSSYVVLLVRANVRRHAPLLADSVNALKSAVGQLTAVARCLPAYTTDGDMEPAATHALSVMAAVSALRRDVADLIRLNQRCWETDDD